YYETPFIAEPVGNQPHGYGIGGFYPCAIYVDGFYWPGYYCTGQLVLIPKSYMGGMFVHDELNGNGHLF
ncbi:unnamed protein product, partial [Rotaria sp. Silwood1]